MSRARSGLASLILAVLCLVAAAPQQPSSTIPTAKIFDAIGVTERVTVCEIGAGDGELTIAAARIVGPKGRVYTSELGAARVKALQANINASRLMQITVVAGDPNKTNFPDARCDALFMRNVYHHFADPTAMDASIFASLKPGGRLAVVDFAPRGKEAERPADRAGEATHGVSSESVTRELKAAGFKPLASEQDGDRGFMVVAAKPGIQEPPEAVPAERLAAREAYRDARLGMFIHWGVYSLLGQGEWVMQERELQVPTYEWLASTFNPIKFDAHEWVALAKAAGMRYIAITARHHDGFSMFATNATPYNIVDWTPFKRDPLKELADECRRQGLSLFFYYSQLDWHHPDYWPRGTTGRATGRSDSGDWNRYLDFMDRQLEELLTGYGPIGGIWFDGIWDKPDAPWRLDRTYALIHRLQPAALIVPNHHKAPLPGEDVQTFEQDLPGANTSGFNTTTIGTLPLETSLTMNRSWGFNITDRNFKSSREIVGYLVRAAGNDANLLLNIGPRPDGTIQPEAVERLQALGHWLAVYGESIYGTRGGPIAPREWGVTTRRDSRVFVHILNWQDRVLSIPAWGARINSARLLATGERVDVTQSDTAITLTLPAVTATEPDRVVVLETR